MSRIFLISDNHFSDLTYMFSALHRDSDEFGFKSTAEMNNTMIKRWNSIVRREDTVFNMGDFAWIKGEFDRYARKLNGKKIFILGNHDFE